MLNSQSDAPRELSRVVSGRLAPIAGLWQIDGDFTFVGFEVQRLFTRFFGRFERVSGTIAVPEDPFQSTIEVFVDTGSVRTGHAATEAAIRSFDLLATEDYPQARFASTGLVGTESDQWRVIGDLTMRDITRPIEMLCRYKGAAQNPFGGQMKLSIEAETSFDRREFDLVNFQDYVPGVEGLMIIGNDVRLTMEVEANLEQ